MSERTEGWGSLSNASSAHYFRDRRSLCGRWLAWGPPQWESNQERGPQPSRGSGTCLACWRKAPEVAPDAANGISTPFGERTVSSNAAECVGFGGECECGCDCCTGNTTKCEPGSEHPVARDHSTMLCPQSKDTLYRTAMVHEG